MGQQLGAILGQGQQQGVAPDGMQMGQMGTGGMGGGVDPKMLLAQLAAQLAVAPPGGYGPSGMVQRTLQNARPQPAPQPQQQPMGMMGGAMPMMGGMTPQMGDPMGPGGGGY
jgi:hypothetical protein